MIDVMNAVIDTVGEATIVKTFVPNIELNKAVNSPFREDNKPSFTWFVATRSKTIRQLKTTIYFYDHANGLRGDIVEYVKIMYALTFNEAVGFIRDVMSSVAPIPAISAVNYTYSYEIDDTDEYQHIRYWQMLGISYDDLALNNVYIVSSANCYENNVLTRTVQQQRSFPLYVYDFKQYGVKFYRPLSEHRFFGNVNSSVVSGLSLIDKNLFRQDRLIIIAKAKKDEVWIRKHVYNNVISFQNERVLNNDVIKKFITLNAKFVIVADNDNAGRTFANNRKSIIESLNSTVCIIETNNEQYKDYTDFAMYGGNSIAINILKENLQQWVR